MCVLKQEVTQICLLNTLFYLFLIILRQAFSLHINYYSNKHILLEDQSIRAIQILHHFLQILQ